MEEMYAALRMRMCAKKTTLSEYQKVLGKKIGQNQFWVKKIGFEIFLAPFLKNMVKS